MSQKFGFAGAVRYGALTALALGFLGGCAKTTSDSASSLTLSGTLSSGSTTIINSLLPRLDDGLKAFSRAALLSFSGYTFKCITLTTPPTTYEGSVSSSGAFSASIPKDTPVRCAFYNSSGTLVATLALTKSGSKGLGGSTASVDSFAPNGDTSLGTVTFDADSGVASGVATSGLLQEGTYFSLDGNYIVASLGSSLPSGYDDVCASSSTNCNGPKAGEPLYIKTFEGYNFTPDSTCSTAATNSTLTSSDTCNGTTGSTKKYAMHVWDSSTRFTACGTPLGFSNTEAKGYGNIDFSGLSGVTLSAPTWSTSVSKSGSTINLTEGWKATNDAKTQWGFNNCRADSVNGTPAFRCTDAQGDYRIELPGGCTYNGSAFAPANNDWSTVNWGSAGCTEAAHPTVSGFTRQTCSPTYTPSGGGAAQTISCVQNYAIYQSNGTLVTSNPWSVFDWNSTQIVAQNTLCSDAAFNSYPLQRLQCYADYFWKNLGDSVARSNTSVCLPQIQTNWNATTAAEFIQNSGPQRAVGHHLANVVEFLPGNAATVRETHTGYRGVRVTDGTGNSYTNCRVTERMTITMTKYNSAGDLMVMFVSETKNLSTDVNACVANATSQLREGTSRTMFKMVRQ